ncbi:MAG TPA: organomercurial lyase [Candidatus Brocadiia bacterium]|nr:organomercurial lyase [Candidatus Brocadiia bacterium]
MEWGVLKRKELAARCGFCDRAVYPEDAAVVRVDGLYTWGCCAHCSMGVAARTGKDIEVFQPDGLTGEIVTVKTLGGSVASIEPKTSVAWFGQKKTPDGKWVSAGCFHQGFFVNAENLKKWVEGRPYETGRQITIAKSLADKMKMSPQQIQKACKVGECAPK